MTNQIDKTYFWGEHKISGLNDTSVDNNTELDQFIAKYQYIYFVKMFGKTIADNMPAELLALLVNSTEKTSPIANYVYCKYKQNKETESTTAGEKSWQIQNTQIESSRNKIIRSWNEMVNFNELLHYDLYTDETLVIATVPAVPEVIDPPTPAIPEVPGYTITYLTDILPNIKTTDDIFTRINTFGL